MPLSVRSDLVVDVTGRIAFASTTFCDLVGIDFDKVEGKSCFEFFFSEDIHEATKLLNENPDSERFRFRLRRKDGKPVRVDIRRETNGGAITATVTVAPN